VRSVGPIVGGVNTLVQALLDAVRDEGTLTAYVDWESGFEEPIDPTIAGEDIPAFDKGATVSRETAHEMASSPHTGPFWISRRFDLPRAGVVFQIRVRLALSRNGARARVVRAGPTGLNMLAGMAVA